MKSDYIGWISAAGELVKCDDHAHRTVALDISKKLYNYNDPSRPDEVLLSHGWLRVSLMTYGDMGLMFWTPRVMSEYQYSYLRDIFDDDATAISQKGLHILFDNHIISSSELTALI